MHCYELLEFRCDTDARKARCIAYLQDVIGPALSRAGATPVGLFDPGEALSLYVLAVYGSLAEYADVRARLHEDQAYMGPPDAPETPADRDYAEVVSSLMTAFPGMPEVAVPASAPGRIYQLRIYESPTAEAGKRKIGMFHAGEMDLFARVGLDAVFFAESLTGPRLPNLAYMLSFPDRDAQRAAWSTFVQHPDWKRMIGQPHYSDDVIIRNITNIELTALPGSQI